MEYDIDKLLTEARDNGWTRVAETKPPVGQRVDVMHVLSRGYDTHGELDEDGKWHCCNGFILPGMSFTFNPTHWRKRQQ